MLRNLARKLRRTKRDTTRRDLPPSPYPEVYYDDDCGEWGVRFVAVNDDMEIELVEMADYEALDHTDHVIADVGYDAYLLNNN